MIAAYVRVSTKDQNQSLQRDAIDRWARANGKEVKWFADKFTGSTMNRPGWEALWAECAAGTLEAVVIWKLDRLGRSTSAVVKLFEEFIQRGVTLISLTEGFDLSTTAGRLLARMLASFAEFEREIRRERQAAGIQAARDRNGGKCPWGGGVPGKRKASLKRCQELLDMGLNSYEVAAAMGIGRATVMRYKKELRDV